MEVLHDPPTTSSFTPLSDHQSQTPSSFFSGPAILYHHSPSSTLKFHTHDLASAPALSRLAERAQRRTNGTSTAVNGDTEGEDHDEELEVQGVDVWVTSERLLLHSPTHSTGISIPYPTISLHALQTSPSPSLFLQLLASAQTFDDHDPDATISLTIIPSAAPEAPNNVAQAPVAEHTGEDAPTAPQPQDSPTSALYTALSACANLHPDPHSPSSNNGTPDIRFEGEDNINGIYPLNASTTNDSGQATALPPPLPGSSGWITAENVNEFFDEEGNWRGGEEWTESEVLGVPGGGLGEGAGRVRRREEEGEEEGVNGGGGGEGVEGEDETKWRRTE
ncbi:hypothetical protein ACLMJK_001437 [Lecanora helva]